MPTIKKTVKKEKVIAKVENKFNLKVYDLNGKEEESMPISKDIFNIKMNDKLLSQYVHVYLSNQRQGTASSKTRGEVTGSTRKIYRQKGTGRARHGDIKAPIFVGGGTVGGPTPRDYSLKMNKKQKKIALFCALSLKFKENNILGLSNKAEDMISKSKIMFSFLKTMTINKNKILLVLPKLEKQNIILATRNIPNVEMVSAHMINPYIVLTHEKIIIMKNALAILENIFLKIDEN